MNTIVTIVNAVVHFVWGVALVAIKAAVATTTVIYVARYLKVFWL